MSGLEAVYLGTGARFHHVGVVVASIDDLAPEAVCWSDPVQRVRVAFVDLHGAPLELIEPVGPDSPVRRNLERGHRLVHLCFEVPELEASVALALDQGFGSLGPPVPAVAFGGRRIQWLFSPTFGLVELVEAGPR